MAMTHEQFSYYTDIKLLQNLFIYLFILFNINSSTKNMEAIVSAEQDAQTSEICKTELVLLLWLATADVRCTV